MFLLVHNKHYNVPVPYRTHILWAKLLWTDSTAQASLYPSSNSATKHRYRRVIFQHWSYIYNKKSRRRIQTFLDENVRNKHDKMQKHI